VARFLDRRLDGLVLAAGDLLAQQLAPGNEAGTESGQDHERYAHALYVG
jgi:hypothetical protein